MAASDSMSFTTRPRACWSLDSRFRFCMSCEFSAAMPSFFPGALADRPEAGPPVRMLGAVNAKPSGSAACSALPGMPSESIAAASWDRSRVKLTRSFQPVSTDSDPTAAKSFGGMELVTKSRAPCRARNRPAMLV